MTTLALDDMPRTLTASPVELCRSLALVGQRMADANADGDLAAYTDAREQAFDMALAIAWRLLTPAAPGGDVLPMHGQPALRLPRLSLDEANDLRRAIHADNPDALALIQAHPDGGFWLAVYRRRL